MVGLRILVQAIELPQTFVGGQGAHRHVAIHHLDIDRRFRRTDDRDAGASGTDVLDPQAQVV